jgi:hypothetical protein
MAEINALGTHGELVARHRRGVRILRAAAAALSIRVEPVRTRLREDP